jgi:hypothetical protein
MRPWPCILNYDQPLAILNEADNQVLNDIILPESQFDFNYMHKYDDSYGRDIMVGILDYDVLTNLYTVYEIDPTDSNKIYIYYNNGTGLRPTGDLRDLSVLESDDAIITPRFHVGEFAKIPYTGENGFTAYRSIIIDKDNGENYECRLLQPLEGEGQSYTVPKNLISNFKSDLYVNEYVNFLDNININDARPLLRPSPIDPGFDQQLLLGVQMKNARNYYTTMFNLTESNASNEKAFFFYDNIYSRDTICVLDRAPYARLVIILDYLVILGKYVVKYVHEYCDPTFLYVSPEELIDKNNLEDEEIQAIIDEETRDTYTDLPKEVIIGLDEHPPLIFDRGRIINKVVPSGVAAGDIVNIYFDEEKPLAPAVIMEILPGFAQNGLLRIPKYKIHLLYSKTNTPSEYTVTASNLRLIEDESNEIINEYFINNYKTLINREYIRPNLTDTIVSDILANFNIVNAIFHKQQQYSARRFNINLHNDIEIEPDNALLDVFVKVNPDLNNNQQRQTLINLERNKRMKYEDNGILRFRQMYVNLDHIDAIRPFINQLRAQARQREAEERARARQLMLQQELGLGIRENAPQQPRQDYMTIVTNIINNFKLDKPPQVIVPIEGMNCTMSADDISQLPPSNIWMGWDKDLYETIHIDNIYNSRLLQSYFCPICLGWGQRSGGCLYLNHSCSFSGWYHTRLHSRFEEYGKICTCVDCGRICSWGQASHKHFKLSPVDKTSKTSYDFGYPFDENCLKAGGGSLLEKAARIQKMADIYLELMPQRGKITQNEVKVKVIEGCWLAYPQLWTDPDFRERVFTLLRDQRVVFPEELLIDEISSGNVNIYSKIRLREPFIEKHYDIPIIRKMQAGEYNSISYEGPENNTQVIPGIILRHKTRDADGNFIGPVNEHPVIEPKTLVDYAKNTQYSGICMFGETCNGVIWPQEIEAATSILKKKFPDHDNGGLNEEFAANYKRKFMENNPAILRLIKKPASENIRGENIARILQDAAGGGVQGGGALNTDSMYVRLIDETCDLPTRKIKATKGGTRRRGKTKGKTRGNGLRGTRAEGSRQAKPGSKSELPTKGWERGRKKRRQTKKN